MTFFNIKVHEILTSDAVLNLLEIKSSRQHQMMIKKIIIELSIDKKGNRLSFIDLPLSAAV